jgi:hypothetical protein
MGTAVSVMGINMALNGVQDSLVMVGIFVMITVINFGLAGLLLRSVDARPVMPPRPA